MAYFLFSFFNLSGLIVAWFQFGSLPIQPLAFALAFSIVIATTKPKPLGTYFIFAWAFWITLTVGGFLGASRAVPITNKGLWELIIKLWISLVGAPMLTLRVIDRQRLPMLLKTAVVCAVIGSLFTLFQTRYGGMFARILADPGRGAGFWINPNSCSEILVFCLFYSFVYPFRSKSVNLVLRGIILVGVLATLSRTGLVLLLLGFVVYGVMAKRWKTMLQASVVLVIILVAGNLLVGYIKSNTSKAAKDAGASQMVLKRLTRYTEILKGDIGTTAETNDRVLLWQYGWDAIMRDPILGRGHRFMDSVVPSGAGGYGPHNYYLYVWGNSGPIALLAFLAFLVTLVRLSWKCTEPSGRAALMSITAMIAFIAMVDHSFLNTQSYGPLFAVMVAVAYHQRREATPRPAVAMRPMPPAMPPRRPPGPSPRPA